MVLLGVNIGAWHDPDLVCIHLFAPLCVLILLVVAEARTQKVHVHLAHLIINPCYRCGGSIR